MSAAAPRALTSLPRSAWLLLCLLLGGLYPLHMGQDSNSDLKNYHLYNPWALLQGRGDLDWWPAGIQTYYSPLLDVPYYLLAMKWLPHSPQLLAFIMGLPLGLLFFLAALICRQVLGSLGLQGRSLTVGMVLCLLFGISGPAILSQAGTTTNEIPVTVLVLAAVLVLLRRLGTGDQAGGLWRPAALAGGCLGLAAGLKLTACIYAPAAGIGLVLAERRLLPGVLAVYCLAWLAGFSLCDGWWAWHLYQVSGNPLFPYFNSLFHARLLDGGTGLDNRFKPQGPIQALFYPFYWLRSNAHVSEINMVDPRFALAQLAVLILLLRRQAAGWPPALRFLLGFVTMGYVCWEVVFSIYRYLGSLEALLGLLLLAALLRIPGLAAKGARPALLTMAVLLVLAQLLTRGPNWGHHPFADSAIGLYPPVRLSPGSQVVLGGMPLAYMAPLLAETTPGLRFTGIPEYAERSDMGPMRQELRRRLAQPAPLYVMERADSLGMPQLLRDFGIQVSNSCQRLDSNIDDPLSLCRASYRPPADHSRL